MRQPSKLRACASAALLACASALQPVAADEGALLATPLASSASAGKLPSNLPLRRETNASSDAAAWNPAFALLSLAGVAGGLWLWRRGVARGGGRRTTQREHAVVVRLSSQVLTQHASVHAVQWQGEEYLLGCTAQQVTLLSRRPAARQEGDA